MGQTPQDKEVVRLSGGFVSDMNVLNAAEGTTIGERNFTINKDGSRSRRLGLAAETASFPASPSVSLPDSYNDYAFSSYLWESPNGHKEKQFLLIQIAGTLHVHDYSDATAPVLNVAEYSSITSSAQQMISYSEVDGFLVLCGGKPTQSILEYDGASLSIVTSRIKVRDLFGTEDIYNGLDLLSPEYVNYRPATLSVPHEYNLRNQSFGTEIPNYFDSNTNRDPLIQFIWGWRGAPANTESVVPYIGENPVNGNGLRRYNSSSAVLSPAGGTRKAPSGHFIIDLLNRSASRASAIAGAGVPRSIVGSGGVIETDYNEGGPSVIGQFAGRVWYAGFSAEGVTTSTSPHLSSYIAYSQTILSKDAIGRCYQDGDPTSETFFDLVDTDGGLIRLSGVNRIIKLISLGDSLAVVADNGIWLVTGNDGNLFTANSQSVTKVTDRGCSSAASVVEAEGALFYWGLDAIYRLSRKEGGWVSESISVNQKQLYTEIGSVSKASAHGVYDSYTAQIKWTFLGFSITEEEWDLPMVFDVGDTTELILHLDSGAYSINSFGGLSVPLPIKTPSFTVGVESVNIASGSDNVITGTDNLVSTEGFKVGGRSEVQYLSVGPDITGNFVRGVLTSLSNTEPFDSLVDGSSSYFTSDMVTSNLLGPDHQRQKSVKYLTTYMKHEASSSAGGPTAPVVVGSVIDGVDLNGAYALHVSGNYAYVASNGNSSLAVVSIANPVAPVVVGSVTDGVNLSGINSVFVSGSYAYASSQTSDSLTVIDIANPAAPVVVGSVIDGVNLNGAWGLYVSGNYAYVACYSADSLTVVDVSNPAAPSVAGQVIDGTNLNGARDVFVSGGYAYVTSSSSNSLTVIDIANPAAPVVVGSVIDGTNLGGATHVSVSGNYAYVTCFTTDSLTAVDITNPAAPAVVGRVSSAANLDGPWGLYVSGSYAYVACYFSDNLAVVDISDPTALTVAGQVIDGTNLDGARDVFVSGGYAYVASDISDSVTVVKISEDMASDLWVSPMPKLLNDTSLSTASKGISKVSRLPTAAYRAAPGTYPYRTYSTKVKLRGGGKNLFLHFYSDYSDASKLARPTILGFMLDYGVNNKT